MAKSFGPGVVRPLCRSSGDQVDWISWQRSAISAGVVSFGFFTVLCPLSFEIPVIDSFSSRSGHPKGLSAAAENLGFEIERFGWQRTVKGQCPLPFVL